MLLFGWLLFERLPSTFFLSKRPNRDQAWHLGSSRKSALTCWNDRSLYLAPAEQQPCCSAVMVLTVLLAAQWLVNPLVGQTNEDRAKSTPTKELSSAESSTLNQLVTKLVLDEIPHHYTDDRKWGLQQQVYAGFKFRRDQGRLETERVWKQVNHGEWQKFTVALRDPQREFSVTIPQVRKSADGGMLVDIEFVTPLTLSARMSQWQRGLQLYSFSANGWAQVALRLECELKLRVSRAAASAGTPAETRLILEPRVTAATIELREFRLDRVSKVGGEVSQQLGRWVEKELQQKIAQKSPELVTRINQQINRHRERLSIPMDEIVKGDWTQLLAKPLPDDWRQWLPRW